MQYPYVEEQPMAGADKDELNEIRIALTNISDDLGNKAINGLNQDADGDIRIEHRPGATDEITDRMSDHGYEQQDQLSEEAAQQQADAATGHMITIFTRTEK